MAINRDINPFINDEYDLTKQVIFNYINSQSKCSVGIVKSINSNPVSVNVINGIKYFDKIEGFLDPPLLINVPLMQLQNNLYSIKTPLNIGDLGILLWFDREVYTFLLSSGVTSITPDSGNVFNENACVFLPVMQTFSIANTIKQSGVDIVSSQISLITELLTLLTNLATFTSSLVSAGSPYAGNPSATVVGAYPIAVTAAANALGSTLTNINTALTTFKGAQ